MKYTNYLYQLSKYLLCIFLSVMILLVLFQVFNRSIFQLPLFWIDELARFLLVWSAFIGGSIALKDKELAAFDMLENKFPNKLSQYHKIMIEFFVLLFIIITLFYGLKLTFGPSVLGQKSAALRLPMQFVYLSLPVSMFLMLIYSLQNTFTLIKGVKNK